MTTEQNIEQTDKDLEYVRSKRIKIIDALTKDKTPTDPKELGVLLVALSDMDRTSLSKKKIKVDKDAGDNNQQAMDLISSLFNDPRVKEVGKTNLSIDRILPKLSADILPPDLVDGETDANSGSESYDSFTKRVNDSNE
jgi:hypothetical protein